jgi:3-methylcrotonyl-CoA carboxylase alpha subunit
LAHLVFPPGARADTGVRMGDTISPWYDPMIAKIIVHGPTRAIALAQLTRALAETEVAGTVTNLAFLGALARHPGFAAGDVDTGLIARDIDALVAVPPVEGRALALVALAVAGLGGGDALAGFSLWEPLRQGVAFEDGDTLIEAVICPRGPQTFDVEIDGQRHVCTRQGTRWWVDGAPAPVQPVVTQACVYLPGPSPRLFHPVDPLARSGDDAAAGGVVLAPMPGLVKAVFVSAGQAVAKGARLAILEAMKMEHTLTAPRDGIVAEILTEAGAQVEAGAALVRLAEAGE